MLQDLRGVFFIIKGQYKRNTPPRIFNVASGDYNWIGGYDPTSPSTNEWYQLMDNITFTCQRASSDLDQVVRGVYDLITKYKTKDTYLKVLRGLEYHTQSPNMVALDTEIYREYGDYFSALVKEQEDAAYKDLKDKDPVKKARMRFKKRPRLETTTPDTTQERTPPQHDRTTSEDSTPRKKTRGLKIKKRTRVLKTT